jgi:WD40 repeat protein
MADLSVIGLGGGPGIVGADRNGTIWTWNLVTGERRERPLDLDAAAPEDPVPDGDGEIWEVEEDDEDELGMAEPEEVVSRLTAAHLDGRPVVVTGGGRFDLTSILGEDYMGGAVRIWDLETGRKLGKTLTGNRLGVYSLATVPSEQGLLVFSSSEEGRLLVWDLPRGELIAELEGAYNGAMTAAMVGGRPIAVTGGDETSLQAWDVLTGEPLGSPLTGIKPTVRAIAITELNDRAVVVAGGDDESARVWDLQSGEQIGTPLSGHADSIESIGVTRFDGNVVAVTGSRDGTARVWDLARGEQIGEPLAGHEGAVQAVVTSEIDGRPVAVTGGEDGAVRVWSLPVRD